VTFPTSLVYSFPLNPSPTVHLNSHRVFSDHSFRDRASPSQPRLFLSIPARPASAPTIPTSPCHLVSRPTSQACCVSTPLGSDYTGPVEPHRLRFRLHLSRQVSSPLTSHRALRHAVATPTSQACPEPARSPTIQVAVMAARCIPDMPSRCAASRFATFPTSQACSQRVLPMPTSQLSVGHVTSLSDYSMHVTAISMRVRLLYAVPVTSPSTLFVSDYTGPRTSPHSAPVTAILTTLCTPTRSRLPECAQVDACPTHLRCALQDRLLNSAHVLRSRLLMSSFCFAIPTTRVMSMQHMPILVRLLDAWSLADRRVSDLPAPSASATIRDRQS
jgi:hypothetical protein